MFDMTLNGLESILHLHEDNLNRDVQFYVDLIGKENYKVMDSPTIVGPLNSDVIDSCKEQGYYKSSADRFDSYVFLISEIYGLFIVCTK